MYMYDDDLMAAYIHCTCTCICYIHSVYNLYSLKIAVRTVCSRAVFIGLTEPKLTVLSQNRF